MIIRRAVFQDVSAIVQLIQPYVNDFTYSEEGRKKFTVDFIQTLVTSSDIQYWVLDQGGQMMGVIAYREPAHLVHFFVNQNHLGQGVGRQLWQYIEAMMNSIEIKMITVNSSCYAEKFYKKLGFSSVSDVIEAHGLRFIKMQKHLI